MLKENPTDLKILECIYTTYFDNFISRSQNKEESNNGEKIYVPVDLDFLAQKLRINSDILFSRLYYHLEKKYGYKQDFGNCRVSFFTYIRGNTNSHAVHFPYLCGILAREKEIYKKESHSTIISLIAVGISILGVILNYWPFDLRP